MVSDSPREWGYLLPSAPGSVWSQRRVLGEVTSPNSARTWIFGVLAPDGRAYLEDYSGRSQSVAAVRFGEDMATSLPGVIAEHAYSFSAEHSDATLDEARDMARESAAEWC